MYTVWHVDTHKITFKLVINHWTNEIMYHIVVSSGPHLGLNFSTHSRIFFCSEYFHFNTLIHEKCLENWNNKFQENLSWPGIIDARARYRAAARRLRNTGLKHMSLQFFLHGPSAFSTTDSLKRADHDYSLTSCPDIRARIQTYTDK